MCAQLILTPETEDQQPIELVMDRKGRKNKLMKLINKSLTIIK